MTLAEELTLYTVIWAILLITAVPLAGFWAYHWGYRQAQSDASRKRGA